MNKIRDWGCGTSKCHYKQGTLRKRIKPQTRRSNRPLDPNPSEGWLIQKAKDLHMQCYCTVHLSLGYAKAQNSKPTPFSKSCTLNARNIVMPYKPAA